MRRRLTNLATMLSLALCVATVTLWVRSYWHFDDVHLFLGPQRYWMLRSAEGRLYAQQMWADAYYWQGPRRWEYWGGELGRAHYTNLPFRWQVAGFGYG